MGLAFYLKKHELEEKLNSVLNAFKYIVFA